ncbi:3-keto-disaccharide hydrolase [Jiulongibacter sp. NS-SX5]|uniref:3-keto-disaccharide hydrolase n=1 Tax=Jiulongibacter sp. NS-SX5 TaxID=3463854 RepID=UPI004057FE18
MKKLVLFGALLVLNMACQPSADEETQTENKLNTLSEKELNDGWQLLFNGKDTNGWHLYNAGDTASAWVVTDAGELFCKPDTFEVAHGDLLTDQSFENYELLFDWKISEAGNSGVFINVQEEEKYPTAWTTGPEYQLLDNLGIHAEYLEDSTRWAACLYGFKPNLNTVEHKPAGEWNQGRIIQQDGVVEFYLNGVKTAEQDLKTDEWRKMIAATGFQHFQGFGAFTSGHIALQDWAKGVWFRNIKIKEN